LKKFIIQITKKSLTLLVIFLTANAYSGGAGGGEDFTQDYCIKKVKRKIVNTSVLVNTIKVKQVTSTFNLSDLSMALENRDCNHKIDLLRVTVAAKRNKYKKRIDLTKNIKQLTVLLFDEKHNLLNTRLVSQADVGGQPPKSKKSISFDIYSRFLFGDGDAQYAIIHANIDGSEEQVSAQVDLDKIILIP